MAYSHSTQAYVVLIINYITYCILHTTYYMLQAYVVLIINYILIAQWTCSFYIPSRP